MINKISVEDFKVSFGDVCVSAVAPFSLSGLAGVQNDASLYTESRFSAVAFVSDDLFDQPYAYLILPGFDSDDTVYFNGTELAVEKGRAPELCVDVKQYLKQGENTITICPADLPGSAEELDQIGCFSPLKLVFFDTALVRNVLTDYSVDVNGTLTVDISLDILGSFDNCNAVATLVSPAGQYYYGSIADCKGQIVITEPLLWSASDIGVPNLYKLSVTLYCGGEFEDTFEITTGYRSVVATESVPVINGKQFVIRGAVYQSNGISSGSFDKDKYETLVDAAASSGVNTFLLRDTRFISDNFFSLCDKHGIAVIVEGCLDDYTAGRHPSVIAVFGEWGMSYAGLNMDRSAPWDYEIINIAPSLPSYKRIRGFVPDSEMNLFSRTFECGDEAFGRNVSLVTNIASEYRFVSDIHLLSYLSGVCVGEEILKSTATRDKSLTSSLVASSFNSASPLISDGLVDRLGMPKASLFFLKQAYGEAQVYSYRNSSGTVGMILCNNTDDTMNGTLKWSLLDNSNALHRSESLDVSIAPNSDTVITTPDLSEYTDGNDNSRYLLCELTVGANVVARSVMLFSKTKHFDFLSPEFTAKITSSGNDFIITLSANCFAHRVRLEFKNIDGSFSENYFDITSESPKRITFTPLCSTTEENLINELEIISMYDIR